MKHRIVIAILGFLFCASFATGAIEPPYKEIEYCYRIENSQDYPSYGIIARFPDESDVPLQSDECFARRSADEIIAIQKDGSSTIVLSSGIHVPVSPVKVYDLSDPRQKIEDVFTVDALEDRTFSLRLAKKIVRYEDGSVREKVYTTAEEGLADPPDLAYRYTDTPASPSEKWFDGESRPIRSHGMPDCSSGEGCSQSFGRGSIIDPRHVALNIFRIVNGSIAIIAVVLIFWSGFKCMIGTVQRQKYKRVLFFSFLALIAIMILNMLAYWYGDIHSY